MKRATGEGRTRSGGPRPEMDRLRNQVTGLQRDLERANGEMERLHRENLRLIGMAAHDLRTPLTAIKFYSQFLLTQPPTGLSEEQRRFVSIIHSSSDFMSRLVNDLLDVSRIESGGLKLSLASVDLADVVSQSVALLAVIAGRKDVRITFTAQPMPPMMLDGQKIRQVVDNLLGNAVKYTPQGSVVKLGLSRRARGGAVLRVQDEGPGLPPAEIQRVMRPAGRATAAGPAEQRTTGLGLAIVKRVVEGHRGTVRVETGEDKGTTFVVELPGTKD